MQFSNFTFRRIRSHLQRKYARYGPRSLVVETGEIWDKYLPDFCKNFFKTILRTCTLDQSQMKCDSDHGARVVSKQSQCYRMIMVKLYLSLQLINYSKNTCAWECERTRRNTVSCWYMYGGHKILEPSSIGCYIEFY